jgi:hypothetical protein
MLQRLKYDFASGHAENYLIVPSYNQEGKATSYFYQLWALSAYSLLKS